MFKQNLASTKFFVLLLLVSLLQTWTIFRKAQLYTDSASLAVIFSLWALLTLVNGIGIYAFMAIVRRWSLPRALVLVSGTLTVAIFVAAYHYMLFAQHLNRDTIAFAMSGIAAGEAGTDSRLLFKILAGIVLIYLAVAAMAYAVWRPYRSSHGALRLIVLAPVVVGLNLIGLGWRSVSHATELSYDTQAYIPWVSFLPERELPDLVKFEPPISRGGLFEVDDIRRLGTEKARILAAEVRAEHRPNILFVHIECLRAGIFNAENMPELYRQSSGALQFLPAHYTTGPNTGIGIHGLINGLADTYYQAARQSWFHPVTLAILKKLGYSNSVYATRDLGYEQLGDLFFAETLDHAQLTNDGDFTGREARMVDRYLDDLRRDDGKRPRFDYLMFYATHFDYFFPPEFAKYQPVSSLGFEMESGRNPDRASMRDGLFNRYRNSALYVDYLVNRIVEYLQDSGRLENTVVVIVGDHGEEFWEHGAFGHVYGLVNEQIHVPALVHFPRPLPASERLTSHQDFFPTIFDFMKLETPGGDCRFTTGRSLYQAEPGEDFVTVSLGIKQKNLKFTEMVIGKDYKVRIEFRDKLQVTGVFDAEDHPLADFDRSVVMRLVRQAVASKRGDLPRCAAGAEKHKPGQLT